MRDLSVDPEVDPNLDVIRGETALSLACFHGRVDVVKFLLSLPKIIPGNLMNLALKTACTEGHLEIVRVLLASNQCKGLHNEYYEAAERNHVEILRALLQYQRYPRCNEPSMFRICHKYPKTVEMLLQEFDFDPRGREGYDEEVIRATYCYPEVLKILLRDGRADPTVVDSIVLRAACFAHNVESVRALLEDGRADPAARGNEAIRTASRCYDPELARILLADSRVDPSVLDNLALRTAVSYSSEVVKLLLAHPQVDPTALNDAAFFTACMTGRVDAARLLFKDERVQQSLLLPGRLHAALMGAVTNKQPDVVSFLVKEANVDPSFNDNEVHLHLLHLLFSFLPNAADMDRH